jgi:hypothetical protein
MCGYIQVRTSDKLGTMQFSIGESSCLSGFVIPKSAGKRLSLTEHMDSLYYVPPFTMFIINKPLFQLPSFELHVKNKHKVVYPEKVRGCRLPAGVKRYMSHMHPG